MKKTLVLVIAVGLAGCGTVKLPSNVTTIQGGSASGKYIDRVDYSYDETVEFSALKLCVAENVSNDGVTMTDQSESWVGPWSGNTYSRGNTSTTSGGDTFKYMDDATQTVIAVGTVPESGQGLIQRVVRFDLKAATKNNKVTLVFSKITHVQKDTGYAANTGFSQIGDWHGAGALDAVAALEGTANRIKSCLR